jgi:hypothetical protein
MSNVLIIPNFISQDVCQAMNNWVYKGVANKWLDSGISRGSGWTYKDRLTTRAYGNRFEYPQIVYDVFAQITEQLHLQDLPKSLAGGGRNGIVVSCTNSGGDVYEHKDPMEGELHVLRCNIMTSKADEGAELFIDGEKINIEVGDLHCYLPSNVPHYVTTAQGHTSRIMWMFGYQISIKQWQEKTDNFYVC